MSIICFADDLPGLSRFGLSLAGFLNEEKLLPDMETIFNFSLTVMKYFGESNAKIYSKRYNESVTLAKDDLWLVLVINHMQNSRPYSDLYQLYKSMQFVLYNTNQADIPPNLYLQMMRIQQVLINHPYVKKIINLPSLDQYYFWGVNGEDYTLTITTI